MSDFISQNIPTTPQSGDYTSNKVPSTAIQTGNTISDPALAALWAVRNRADIKAQVYTNPVIKTNLSDANASYAYYSPELGYSSIDPQLEQRYESRQGIWDSIKNRLLKTGANAVTGLYSGFSATSEFLTGGGKKGITGEAGINELNQFTEELATKLPNFKSQYDIDHPYVNTHMAGQIVESLGFTVGAIGSSLVVDALIAPLLGGLGTAVLLPKQLALLTSKWGKLSSALAQGGKSYKTLLTSIDEAGDIGVGITKALKNYNTYSKITDGARFGINVGISSLGESQIEASQTSREIEKNLKSEHVDEYGNYNGDDQLLGKIKNTALQGGANTLLPNFLFLSVSNSLGLSSILRPSRAAIKATEEALGSRIAMTITDANTIAAKTTPYSKGIVGLLERAKSPTAMIKDNLRESFEEGYQFVVSDANKNYYQRKFNARSNNDATTMQDEYYNSIGRAFTTEEGIQSMIMGFGGGMMQNGIKRVVNRARGVKTGAALAASIQNNLNTYTTTAIFNSPRTEAVTSESILREMEIAAENGDILGYKNLQLEALFNWVHSGVKNNKFDARLQQLESLKGIDPESFQTMWGVDLNEGSKKTVDAFIDAVANKAKNIKENVEKVENAFGKNSFSKKDSPLKYAAFNNYKQELAVSLSQLDDYKRRVTDIKNNISQSLPAINLDEVVELSSVEGILRTIDRFNTRIGELKNSEQLSSENKSLSNTFKEEREFLERRVKEMSWATQDNQNYTQDFLGTINSIHNYYGNGNKVRGNFSISELDSYNILANSKDVDILLKEAQRVSSYYRELSKKDGYIEFERKYTKDLSDYIDNLIITSDGKVKVKEPPVKEAEAEVKKKKEEELTKTLAEVGVEDVAALKEEIKAGNIVIRGGGLRRRGPEDPKTTEEEMAEAEAFADYWENALTGEEYDLEAASNPQPETTNESTNIREKANTLEDDVENPSEEPSAKPNKKGVSVDDVIDQIITIVDKTWSNSVFKFYNFFNKMNSWKDTKTNEDYSGNLLEALLNNSQEDVLNNLTFKLEDAPKSTKKSAKVPLFVKQADGSYKKEFTDLKTNPYKFNVEVWYKNKKVGILQEPERLGFEDANGDFITLGNVTPEVYAQLTKNNQDTFDSFKEQYDAYKKAYDSITSLKDKKKVFSNEEIKKVFDPLITYGRIATTKNQEFSLKVSELKLWKGSGIVQLNDANELVILNSEELSPQELTELIAYIGKQDVDSSLRKSGRDYFVISKLPDGTFRDKMAVIYARPETATILEEDGLNRFKKGENLGDITVSLSSKEHGSTKFSFTTNENGNVVMVMTNKKRTVRQSFVLKDSEIQASEDLTDIADVINLALKGINNPLLRKIGLEFRKEDFKQSTITNKSSLADIKNNLKAAVSSKEIYTGFGINFYPVGTTPQGPTAPKAPTTSAPQGTATTTPEQPIAPTPQPEAPVDIVPEKEYMEFVDKNVATKERLESLADKVINREKLSPYETAIFNGKTSEVEEIIKNKAMQSEPIEDQIVNGNLSSIISQLESKGFLTKNCD